MHVSNGGNVTLTGVDVTDPLSGLGALACSIVFPPSLAPCAMLNCTADYVIQASNTIIVNTATVTSDQTGPVDNTVTVDMQ